MKRVTLKDVAKELGVAFSTVSMALSDDKTISQKMKEKVKKKIQEMGYHPNRSARNLVNGKTNNIAVVTPGLFSLYEMHIVRGMELQMVKSKYDLILYTAKYDWGEVHKELRKILYEQTADAVIVIGVMLENEIVEEFKKAKIPLVLVDSGTTKKAFTLNVDNYECGRIAARYFIKKGSKKPAIMLGNTKFAFSQSERLRGFKAALKEKGMKFKNEMAYEKPDYLPEDLRKVGFAAAEVLVKNGTDAIYCASGDYVAQGIYRYCAVNNITMPETLMLVGTDNFDVADALNLSTIEQPLVGMGMKAFELAEQAAADEGFESETLFFKPKLIIRKT
ncbi:MAG: LacI family DNA-binding transcriptional regulator [Candidatus Goldbacteria bacterium]|nr:LacI family DNA-binding transcriptional regulator [Candidatus Goldiibacteriota bacterium]